MGIKHQLKKAGHNRLSKHTPSEVKEVARTKQGRTARRLARHQSTSMVASPITRYAAEQVSKQIRDPGSKVDPPTKGLLIKQAGSMSSSPAARYGAQQAVKQARARGVKIPNIPGVI